MNDVWPLPEKPKRKQKPKAGHPKIQKITQPLLDMYGRLGFEEPRYTLTCTICGASFGGRLGLQASHVKAHLEAGIHEQAAKIEKHARQLWLGGWRPIQWPIHNGGNGYGINTSNPYQMPFKSNTSFFLSGDMSFSANRTKINPWPAVWYRTEFKTITTEEVIAAAGWKTVPLLEKGCYSTKVYWHCPINAVLDPPLIHKLEKFANMSEANLKIAIGFQHLKTK